MNDRTLTLQKQPHAHTRFRESQKVFEKVASREIHMKNRQLRSCDDRYLDQNASGAVQNWAALSRKLLVQPYLITAAVAFAARFSPFRRDPLRHLNTRTAGFGGILVRNTQTAGFLLVMHWYLATDTNSRIWAARNALSEVYVAFSNNTVTTGLCARIPMTYVSEVATDIRSRLWKYSAFFLTQTRSKTFL